MTQVSDDAEQWRRLAEELRSEAEQITNARAKQMMLTVAETYEAMAGRAKKKEPPGDEAERLVSNSSGSDQLSGS